jgi:hypothetical protein
VATTLAQLLAVRKTVNNDANRAFTKAYQVLQKAPLLAGIIKVYRPRSEDGEQLPGEVQHVQIYAATEMHDAVAALKRMFTIVGAIDATNCHAKADVVIDGSVVLADVPVTHLLWMEKQLQDLHTFLSKLPVLDPSDQWTTDIDTGLSTSTTKSTTRGKKVPISFVKAAATDKHPAQVEVLFEDQIVGDWLTTRLSGAARPGDVAVLKERCHTVFLAVKYAREQANSAAVYQFDSTPLLEYIIQPTKTPR